jgi:3-oxoacyl-[acyl-carrier-protein] synthase II
MKKRVVITGLGAISPIGLNIEESFDSALNGKSGISVIESFDTTDLPVKIAAEVKSFDPIELLGRKESKRLDRFSQFACVAARQAVKDGKLDIDSINTEKFAVILGSGVGGIMTLSKQFEVMKNQGANRVSPFLIPMMLPDMASGRVSMDLGAKGPNFCPVSACATGADAIGEATEMIKRGVADLAIAGGSEAAICPIALAGFASCKALSMNNEDPVRGSRPFDLNRDGFVLGEGAGVLLIEELEHAKKRGANILAEIIGYGASSDAFHITQPSPGGEGAARAMKIAIEQAEIKPEEIGYINAHGTSTPMNDKFETMSIKSVFKDHAYNIPISSTKSTTGHLLGAAGSLEATFSIMILKNGEIPPTSNLETSDPECDLDYVPNNSIKTNTDTVMSNSLGFGGHNSSLIFRKFSS